MRSKFDLLSSKYAYKSILKNSLLIPLLERFKYSPFPSNYLITNSISRNSLKLIPYSKMYISSLSYTFSSTKQNAIFINNNHKDKENLKHLYIKIQQQLQKLDREKNTSHELFQNFNYSQSLQKIKSLISLYPTQPKTPKNRNFFINIEQIVLLELGYILGVLWLGLKKGKLEGNSRYQLTAEQFMNIINTAISSFHFLSFLEEVSLNTIEDQESINAQLFLINKTIQILLIFLKFQKVNLQEENQLNVCIHELLQICQKRYLYVNPRNQENDHTFLFQQIKLLELIKECFLILKRDYELSDQQLNKIIKDKYSLKNIKLCEQNSKTLDKNISSIFLNFPPILFHKSFLSQNDQKRLHSRYSNEKYFYKYQSLDLQWLAEQLYTRIFKTIKLKNIVQAWFLNYYSVKLKSKEIYQNIRLSGLNQNEVQFIEESSKENKKSSSTQLKYQNIFVSQTISISLMIQFQVYEYYLKNLWKPSNDFKSVQQLNFHLLLISQIMNYLNDNLQSISIENIMGKNNEGSKSQEQLPLSSMSKFQKLYELLLKFEQLYLSILVQRAISIKDINQMNDLASIYQFHYFLTIYLQNLILFKQLKIKSEHPQFQYLIENGLNQTKQRLKNLFQIQFLKLIIGKRLLEVKIEIRKSNIEQRKFDHSSNTSLKLLMNPLIDHVKYQLGQITLKMSELKSSFYQQFTFQEIFTYHNSIINIADELSIIDSDVYGFENTSRNNQNFDSQYSGNKIEFKELKDSLVKAHIHSMKIIISEILFFNLYPNQKYKLTKEGRLNKMLLMIKSLKQLYYSDNKLLQGDSNSINENLCRQFNSYLCNHSNEQLRHQSESTIMNLLEEISGQSFFNTNKTQFYDYFKPFYEKIVEISLGQFKWESFNQLYYHHLVFYNENDHTDPKLQNLFQNIEYVRRYILNEYNAMGINRRQIPTYSYFYRILEKETSEKFYKNYFNNFGQHH